MAVAEPVFEPDVAPAATGVATHKPSPLTKLGYAFGQAIESGYLIVAGFVFFYYTAVLGLSGTAVGVALGISMCLDALMDPLIGSVSDNLRSLFGRRLPLMLLGLPLTALTLVMLFAPPVGLQPIILFTWLVAAKMLLRGSASIFNLPYQALGAELTNDYFERASVAAYRGVAGIVTSLAVIFLAYGVYFAGAGGLQIRGNYPAFGIAAAILLFVAGAIGTASIWRYARRLPQPIDKGASLTRGLFEGLPEVFRNPSFISLFFSAMLFWMAAGINGAFNNYAYVFIWKLPAEKIQFVSYAFYVAILAGIPLTRPLLARFEKRTLLIAGLVVFVAALNVLHILRATGVVAPTGDASLPWLFATVIAAGFGIGLLVVAYPAVMGDAADEHEVKFRMRREGLYFAGLGFAAKAAAGLGQTVAGFALDALHFPKGAGATIGAEEPEHTLRLLVLAWGPLPAVFALGSALALVPFAVTRARHGAIAADLKEKRARDVSEGRSS
jgi:GPH family glycoside/pentoside/hexuronide:cation symporter